MSSQQDISHRTLQLARLLDRELRRPGRYTVTITIPENPRQPWQAELSRIETIRRFALRRTLKLPRNL